MSQTYVFDTQKPPSCLYAIANSSERSLVCLSCVGAFICLKSPLQYSRCNDVNNNYEANKNSSRVSQISMHSHPAGICLGSCSLEYFCARKSGRKRVQKRTESTQMSRIIFVTESCSLEYFRDYERLTCTILFWFCQNKNRNEICLF